MKETITLIFLFINICNAQEDTLKSYFPLSVGNYWQYKVTHYTSNDTTTSYAFTEILKDTIITDKSTLYYKLKVAFNCNLHISEFQYLRYDSSSHSIIEYSPFADGEGIFVKLNTNHNDTWKYYQTDVCTIPDVKLLFGEMKYCRNFYDCGSSPPFWEYTLVKKFGPIRMVDDQSWGFLNFTTYNLVYAKIDGIEYGSLVTSVKNQEQVPSTYSISQNYPNPFNPTTTINYSIPKTCHVSIQIYNSVGEKIELLVDELQPAGNYDISFNGNNLSSGIYYYQIKAGEYLETKKMALIK